MAADPKPRRRWFRFNLRSLLIFTVLVGVLMGWIVRERAQSGRDLEIAEQLRESGVLVRVAGRFDEPAASMDKQAGWRIHLGNILGPRVRLVESHHKHFNDLRRLAGLNFVEWLSLDNSGVSDLTPLVGVKVHHLKVSRTQIADLTPLAGLTDLRSLGLDETKIRNLTPLVGLKNLESLNLSGTQVSDLAPLAGLGKLKYLELAKTQVSDLTPLAKLDRLEQLDLTGTAVSDLTPLIGLKSLTHLHLNSTLVRDLRPLVGLKNLKRLYLTYTPVRNLTPLAELKALQQLHIKGTKITNEQVEFLQQALPNCKIDRDWGALAATVRINGNGQSATPSVDADKESTNKDREAIANLVESARMAYKSTDAAWAADTVPIENIFTWSIKLLDAELLMAENGEERLTALRNYVDRTENVANQVKSLYDLGERGGEMHKYWPAKFYYEDAQRRLAKELHEQAGLDGIRSDNKSKSPFVPEKEGLE